jgi:hypothetical protein
MDQRCEPGEVSAGLRRELIDCWITVTNAGGAAGFPFPPVDDAIVAPVADQLIASLSPGRSRLLLALAGRTLWPVAPHAARAPVTAAAAMRPKTLGALLTENPPPVTSSTRPGAA